MTVLAGDSRYSATFPSPRAFSCTPTFAPFFSSAKPTVDNSRPTQFPQIPPSSAPQCACTSQSRLLPHHLSWVLKPSMLLAYFSVLPTHVERSLKTTQTHSFVSVCVAPGAIKVAWAIDWSRLWWLFAIYGEYRGQRLDEPFPMMRDKEGGC